jgi:hypothetical protein
VNQNFLEKLLFKLVKELNRVFGNADHVGPMEKLDQPQADLIQLYLSGFEDLF